MGGQVIHVVLSLESAHEFLRQRCRIGAKLALIQHLGAGGINIADPVHIRPEGLGQAINLRITCAMANQRLEAQPA